MNRYPSLGKLTQAIIEKLPAELQQGKAGIEHNVRLAVGQVAHKLELVDRREFDAQSKVLERAERQIEQLEQRIVELERQLQQHKS